MGQDYQAVYDKEKRMKRFVKENKWITRILIIKISIIVLYLLSIDMPELFKHAEYVFNFFYNLAIGYCVSFIFYVLQVYIPLVKRTEKVNEQIRRRLIYLNNDMMELIREVVKVQFDRIPDEPYTENQLKELLKVDTSRKLKILKLETSLSGQLDYFTLKEWLITRIVAVERDIDRLLTYYTEYLDAGIVADLEDILNTAIHTHVKSILGSPNDVSFAKIEDNYYWKYYQLARKIRADADLV